MAPDLAGAAVAGGPAVELGRPPGVTVVEPDDAVAGVEQARAEAARPHRQLRAEPGDQHHGRVGGVSHVLVVDRHVAGIGAPGPGPHYVLVAGRVGGPVGEAATGTESPAATPGHP